MGREGKELQKEKRGKKKKMVGGDPAENPPGCLLPFGLGGAIGDHEKKFEGMEGGGERTSEKSVGGEVPPFSTRGLLGRGR